MKSLMNYLIVFVVGFASGNLFWYLASPLWIDRVVDEAVITTSAESELKTGQFKDADFSHKGRGKVSLVKTGNAQIIRFEDFKVTNGPDLFVWLVKNPSPNNSQDVKDSETISLGVLKGNIGNQNYTIPADVDINEYGSVVIWCRQFGVLFASAELK